jgi:hypothetical protein
LPYHAGRLPVCEISYHIGTAFARGNQLVSTYLSFFTGLLVFKILAYICFQMLSIYLLILFAAIFQSVGLKW